MPAAFFLIVILLFGCSFWSIFTFNEFISLRNHLREAWSEIEVQLSRRHALIPHLLSSLEMSRAEDAGSISRLRHLHPVDPGGSRAMMMAAEEQITADLSELLRVETGPNVQAHVDRLVEIEERLQTARRSYNKTARRLNTLSESFPSMFIASAAGQSTVPFFEVRSASERLV